MICHAYLGRMDKPVKVYFSSLPRYVEMKDGEMPLKLCWKIMAFPQKAEEMQGRSLDEVRPEVLLDFTSSVKIWIKGKLPLRRWKKPSPPY